MSSCKSTRDRSPQPLFDSAKSGQAYNAVGFEGWTQLQCTLPCERSWRALGSTMTQRAVGNSLRQLNRRSRMTPVPLVHALTSLQTAHGEREQGRSSPFNLKPGFSMTGGLSSQKPHEMSMLVQEPAASGVLVGSPYLRPEL